MGLPSTSLRIGGRVISTCDDGLLGPEYSLFEAGNVVLQSWDASFILEQGYLTTAQTALACLERLGVTPELADRAAAALPPGVVSTFAYGDIVDRVIDRLGAYELFEGAIFAAATQRYRGSWLDLSDLAMATGVPGAAAAMQAFHLAAALREVDGEVPVLLSTAGLTPKRKPGERTFRRVPLPQALLMPSALAALKPRKRPIYEHEVPLRALLLQRVQERGAYVFDDAARVRLAALQTALASDGDTGGPLSDSGLWAVESRLSSGDIQGIEAQIDTLEDARGDVPSIAFLRARAALLRGDVPPKDIAKQLSDLSTPNKGFFELALLAAQAWLAAGERTRARSFARALIDNPLVPDGIRLHALDIFESATVPSVRPGVPRPGPPGSRPPRARSSAPPGASKPPFVSEPPPHMAIPRPAPVPAWSEDEDGSHGAELVETLALPPGADASMLASGASPTSALEARIACTRLAQELARDYRLSYGTTLRADALAIDAMQSHLRLRFTAGQAPDAQTVHELHRHGALLSEILARTLGGEWVDVGPSDMAYWAMVVPPNTRVWPIGRVCRFFALGNLEKDLVSYYLDLEMRARGDGS